MEQRTKEIYLLLAPGLEEVEPGKLRGRCVFCGEDGFMAGGLVDASTGEGVDNFLCMDCDRDGSPEEFVQALKRYQPQR